jgi:hypothetical protein
MNTISQTITTLAAIKPAAITPQICESNVTPRMNRSIYGPLCRLNIRLPAGLRPAGCNPI